MNAARALVAPPPIETNERGELRRVGVEFEYADVDVRRSSEIVVRLFGGRIDEKNRFRQSVEDTELGTFGVEIDTSILKEKKYEAFLESLGVPLDAVNMDVLEQSLLTLFTQLVPFEIVTPPIPFPELCRLDELREALRDAGAKGTHASLLYAFGLHLNVEVPSLDPYYLRDIIRAFVLLHPVLKTEREVDFSRRIARYIEPFSRDYGLLVTGEGYDPSAEQLVRDYLEHNPTRNRALDMLPCFAMFARETIESAGVEGKHLVKARPAFHYRLPNCLIDEDSWRITDEWSSWLKVEELAADKEKLRELSEEYRKVESSPLHLFQRSWSSRATEFV